MKIHAEEFRVPPGKEFKLASRTAGTGTDRDLQPLLLRMAQLTPEFSVGRSLPGAAHYALRAANDSALGAELLRRQQNIAQEWTGVRFGQVDCERHDALHSFRGQIFPGQFTAQRPVGTALR